MTLPEQGACCIPIRQPNARIPDGPASSDLHPLSDTPNSGEDITSQSRFVALPGGNVVIGENGPLSYPADGEEPVKVEVGPFAISATCVSNAEFAEFVEATGYRSEAERFGWSFVFGPLLPDKPTLRIL
jgi:formylglycine-generating enzyme